ncbi:MAG TPA: SRPBCC domain-containing protein [Candidatus Bathyarchaeia archaeon]|nr:SRPBCC domain-containing protein [Candidatus Bathyarchaeia archaeon]
MRTFTSGWTIVKEISILSSPARIFKALTAPEDLDRWFTEGARVDLRVGGRYSNQDKDRGKFLEIVRGKRLRYTWENPDHAPDSIVEFLLKRSDDHTLVTLVLSGFRKKADFEHYRSRISGWNWALENLKKYLEKKKTVTYEKWLEKHKR